MINGSQPGSGPLFRTDFPIPYCFMEGILAGPGRMGLWRADPECARFPSTFDNKSQGISITFKRILEISINPKK